jgi:hypothetical protein
MIMPLDWYNEITIIMIKRQTIIIKLLDEAGRYNAMDVK